MFSMIFRKIEKILNNKIHPWGGVDGDEQAEIAGKADGEAEETRGATAEGEDQPGEDSAEWGRGVRRPDRGPTSRGH